jgi:hypothetical protein
MGFQREDSRFARGGDSRWVTVPGFSRLRAATAQLMSARCPEGVEQFERG